MEDIFSENNIIRYLCRVRANYAKQRGTKHLVHLISKSPKHNHHKKTSKEEYLIRSLLPPRRKWLKLGKDQRRKSGTSNRITSVSYNMRSLFITTKKYMDEKPEPQFIVNLKSFIDEVHKAFNDEDYEFKKPNVFPIKKKNTLGEDGKFECRPISTFSLKDKLILSLVNQYLTQKLDPHFYNNSHAFRAKSEEGERKDHHSSIASLYKYKVGRLESELWVAECDMRNFYDSVNHNVIKRHFQDMIKVCAKAGTFVDPRAIRVFEKYLDAYAFNVDVLPLNGDLGYWNSKRISGKYTWVQSQLESMNLYSDIKSERIGIPQGGALSGLIANIVLHQADKQILSNADKDLFYVRFCDDMICIHPDRKTCDDAIKAYKNRLIDLNLVPHDFEDNLVNKADSYWSSKSKSAYRWSSDLNIAKAFPWIGFVGYELHFNGSLRVRKSSLKKEVRKQKEIVDSISQSIDKGRHKQNPGYILESARNRLNGMAVGRIQMWNHSAVDAEMCWVNGFTELNDNPTLKKQLKYLDNRRNYQIAILKKKLKDLGSVKVNRTSKTRKYPYYGRPYSYYYQTLKNK